MSILIRGMEMPKDCLDCPFMVSRDNDDCILQSDEANEGFENWEQMKAGCPLIEVPTPHGRLGDLDKLEEYFRAYKFNQAADITVFAPTIIEAEEGE